MAKKKRDKKNAIEEEVIENSENGQSAEENSETGGSKKDELSEMKDKYLRLMAEFENYKKRTFKEKVDFARIAARETMLAILPVLDDFERAKLHAEDENTKEQFSEGVTLVYNKLFSTLEAKGLKKMESTGEAFDPDLHEALSEFPAPSEDLKGKIVDTIEGGYYLNDVILRYAKVVVGK